VALGAGLADGDPHDWTVSIRTASAVAPALARALAAHVEVATEALRVGVDGQVGGGRADVLRGLGYLTLDRAAAAQVERALLAWARVQPGTVDGSDPSSPLAVVAIPSAYLAVEQYGQRLAYAMHGFEEKIAAEGKQLIWNATVGVLVNVLPGRAGLVGGAAEAWLSDLLRTDGTWVNGPDRGLVFDRAQAADAALVAWRPGRGYSGALARQAADAFDRTRAALPAPLPPKSPDQDPSSGASDGLAGLRDGEKWLGRHLHR
jgi:hypothetical protein